MFFVRDKSERQSSDGFELPVFRDVAHLGQSWLGGEETSKGGALRSIGQNSGCRGLRLGAGNTPVEFRWHANARVHIGLVGRGKTRIWHEAVNDRGRAVGRPILWRGVTPMGLISIQLMGLTKVPADEANLHKRKQFRKLSAL